MVGCDRPNMKIFRTGISDDIYIEVLEGLDMNDHVITDGHSTLTEKSRVRVVNKAPKQSASAK